jgi:hypothetical protein
VASELFNSADQSIIFKFNYTENRELFEIGPMQGGVPFSNKSPLMKKPADPTGEPNGTVPLLSYTCKNGDYGFYNGNDS